MSEQQLEELKTKVDKLEYVEIKELKEDINQVKIDLNTNNILTKQSIESNQKLNETMDTLKTTMIELAQSVKDGNKATSELTSTVDTLNIKVNAVDDKVDKKFTEVNNKIGQIDEKSKIDILTWLRSNWLGATMGIGAIVYAITQIVK